MVSRFQEYHGRREQRESAAHFMMARKQSRGENVPERDMCPPKTHAQ